MERKIEIQKILRETTENQKTNEKIDRQGDRKQKIERLTVINYT